MALNARSAVVIAAARNLTTPERMSEPSTGVGDIPAQLVQDFDIDPKEVDMLYVDMPVADAAMVIQVK